MNKNIDKDSYLDVTYMENKMRSNYNPILNHVFETKEYISDYDLNNTSFLIKNNINTIGRVFNNMNGDETTFNSDFIVDGSIISHKKASIKEGLVLSFEGEKASTKESALNLKLDDSSFSNLSSKDSYIDIDFDSNSKDSENLVLFSILSSDEKTLLEISQIGDEIGIYIYNSTGSDSDSDYDSEFPFINPKAAFVYNEVKDQIKTDYKVIFGDLIFRDNIKVNNLIASRYVRISKEEFENLDSSKGDSNNLGSTGSKKVDDINGKFGERITLRYENGFLL